MRIMRLTHGDPAILLTLSLTSLLSLSTRSFQFSLYHCCRLDLCIGNPELKQELKGKSKEDIAKHQFGLVTDLINAEDWDALWSNDELTQDRVAGKVFHGFTEATCTGGVVIPLHNCTLCSRQLAGCSHLRQGNTTFIQPSRPFEPTKRLWWNTQVARAAYCSGHWVTDVWCA
jgi:hypothetical protein